ncbi:MAG TPA: penicillin-binding protein [Polyangiaceae bacterium]|nr:penicillin-binding protein [Polyangiaceae bacterium]
MNRINSEAGRFIRLRMGILCGLLALGMGLVVSAGFTLQMVDGNDWRDIAEKQRQRRLHMTPKRGTVYDRNGSALAVSVDVPGVSLDSVELLRSVPPQRVPVVARDAANRIAQALAIDPAEVERKILKKRRFTWLKHYVTPEETENVRGLSEGDNAIPGLVVEGEGRRFYPRRELAASLLGFVSPDGDGKDGLELSLNPELEGHVEQLRGLRDRSGRLLFSDGIQDEQALAGHDINLTIDQGIQFVAERALRNAARTFEAAAGSVVVVDPHTGEILALASFPGYNPNDYSESDPEARRERALSERFEPGSSMKMFTVAAGLAAGTIQPTQQLYCEKGAMPLDNVIIRDTHPSEWLTISQVLAISSNICAAKIALGMGGEKLYEALRRFGFGQPTELPLPGESSGVLRPQGRPWVQVETASAAFGQGISVTALQLAMGASAIANGGELMEPILVKRVATATGDVLREAVPKVRRRAVPKSAAKTVAEMLIAVTEGEGTGVQAAIDGYQVAGKTATAQKADPRTGLYSVDKFIASFVGFVPAKDPVVAIAVVIDEPMIEHAGGAVAAPVFREVASMALKYKGLVPLGTEHADPAELARTPDPANAVYAAYREAAGKKPAVQDVSAAGRVPAGKIRLPDFTGFPLRLAIQKSIELGITPKIEGTGLLARQLPAPGQVVDHGAEVVLVFEPAT